MRNSAILCVLLLAAVAVGQYRIGVVGEQATLEAALAEAGYVVRRLDYEDFLSTPSATEQLDCIVFTDSPRFPYAGKDALGRFLRAGGDIVTLRGACFSEPVYSSNGQWLDKQTYLNRALTGGEATFAGIDFETVKPDQWLRDADDLRKPSALTLEDSPHGKRLRFAVKNFSRWDTFRGPFAGKSGHNALAMGLQGTDGLNDIAVEIRERDGSRWVAVVPMGDQRDSVVLLDADFRFFSDKSPAHRGKHGDALNLANASVIQFGLAFDLSPKNPGDYTFFVDKVETFAADLPEGFAAPLFERRLPILFDAKQHRYADASRLRTFAGQDLLAEPVDTAMRTGGLSAVGFPYANQSAFVPLLEALDAFGRRVGFAAGVLIHYDGDYTGGHWLIFGVEQDGFYETDIFTTTTLSTLRALRNGAYAKRLKSENQTAQQRLYQRQRADIVPVRIDKNTGRFVYADGRPFFMVGVNYIGSFDVKCRHASEHFFLHKWEADFEKAARAGINCFRLWIEGLDGRKERFDSIITLANKYGIYLLLLPTAHPLEHAEDLAAMFAELAEWAADEPIVIGYDLMNEPYVNTTASIRFDGEPSPVSRFAPYTRYADAGLYDAEWVNAAATQRTGWPPLGDWIGTEEEAKDLYAAYDVLRRYANRYVPSQDYSSLYGLSGQMPVEPKIADFLDSVNQTFDQWIATTTAAIRQHDTTGGVTVGYNTLLAALPTNDQLDFVSHHLYQSPISYENMEKALTTFDRLARLWPGKPITLGEFGYSTGTKLLDGSLLDAHTAAMAEIMIYLYAYANDCDGAMSWMVTDWPVPLMDFNAPWIAKERQDYESGFGLYAYDGTEQGVAKPIVPAMRFVSDYIGAAEKSGGTFRLVHANTPVGFGYVYENDDALFVGMRDYADNGLFFRSAQTTNVMLRFAPGLVEIVASGDVHITLDRDVLGQRTGGRDFHLTGRCAAFKITEQTCAIDLLAGERITLWTKQNNNNQR